MSVNNGKTDTEFISFTSIIDTKSKGGNQYQVDLLEGWNLIGGVDTVVDLKRCKVYPKKAIVYGAYGYNTQTDAYYFACKIYPGVGYWVFSVEKCTLLLSTSQKENDIQFGEVIVNKYILQQKGYPLGHIAICEDNKNV